MRITRENIEELQSLLIDVESVMSDITDPIATWLDAQDEPGMSEERREARDEIEDNIGGLEDALYGALAHLNPKAVQTKETS